MICNHKVWFGGTSTFVGYQWQIYVYTSKQFYFKQFSLLNFFSLVKFDP